MERPDDNVVMTRADFDALVKERDEARETIRRLNRRCQMAEAMPKWPELGLVAELRSALVSLRHRFHVASHAARTTSREAYRYYSGYIAGQVREWIKNGRPANHTMGEFDAVVDEARTATARANTNAVAAELARARAERAEAALRKIADYKGEIVCERYEVCRHGPCDYGYFANTLASDTLRGTTTEMGDAIYRANLDAPTPDHRKHAERGPEPEGREGGDGAGEGGRE